jgi:hypothetical protein
LLFGCLDPAAHIGDIAAANKAEGPTMDATASTPRESRIIWGNVLTVLSAAVLIAAEVFGAAFAAGWAFATLFNLGEYGVYGLQAIFFLIGIAVMLRFIRNARHVEPFTRR